MLVKTQVGRATWAIKDSRRLLTMLRNSPQMALSVLKPAQVCPGTIPSRVYSRALEVVLISRVYSPEAYHS